MKLVYRKASEKDAENLSILIQNCIRISNSKDYPSDTIELICANFTLEKILEKMRLRLVLVVELSEDLIGTISLEKDKLHSLFVHPDHQGKRIGKALVKAVEQAAAENGVNILTLSSSLTAQGFYEKFGYTAIRNESREDGSTVFMQKRILE